MVKIANDVTRNILNDLHRNESSFEEGGNSREIKIGRYRDDRSRSPFEDRKLSSFRRSTSVAANHRNADRSNDPRPWKYQRQQQQPPRNENNDKRPFVNETRSSIDRGRNTTTIQNSGSSYDRRYGGDGGNNEDVGPADHHDRWSREKKLLPFNNQATSPYYEDSRNNRVNYSSPPRSQQQQHQQRFNSPVSRQISPPPPPQQRRGVRVNTNYRVGSPEEELDRNTKRLIKNTIDFHQQHQAPQQRSSPPPVSHLSRRDAHHQKSQQQFDESSVRYPPIETRRRHPSDRDRSILG